MARRISSCGDPFWRAIAVSASLAWLACGSIAGCEAAPPLHADVADATAPDADRPCEVDGGAFDDALAQLGHTIVASRGCYDCHGGALSGNYDGLPSPTTEGGIAYPPNLTPDPITGLGCWTKDEIENAILDGVDNQGSRLCPPMPLFGHIDDGGLDAAEARAVVAYLRSLPPWVHAVPNTPDCIPLDYPEGGEQP